MPIQSVKNQYPGINAHLHSLWQSESGWSDFHTRHMVHLADALTTQVRKLGYTVQVEQSLQIRRMSDVPRRPKADLLIFDRVSASSFQPSGMSPALIEAIPIAELIAEDEISEARFRAISIYEVDPAARRRGEPVAWIELLSPTNKGKTQDADLYRSKRMDVMVSGLVFVEIDYLHETAPTFPKIPLYPSSGNPRTSPYRIVVLDPRPEVETGESWVNRIEVDRILQPVNVPLNRGDVVRVDFGTVYQKTFQDAFLGDQVDYSQLPLNFERYSPGDQTRIVQRMVAVLQAMKQGRDLESGPFPVEDMTLDEALTRLEDLRKG